MCATKQLQKVSNAVGGGKPRATPSSAGGSAGVMGANKVDADEGDLSIKKKNKLAKKAGGNSAYKNTIAKTNSVNTAGSGSGINVTGG